MTAQIRIAVPAVTTSLFIVAADKPPPTPRAKGVTVLRAGDSPFDLRRVSLYADAVPPPSAFHVVVSTAAPPGDQPQVAQTTRAVARALAVRLKGELIDWATGALVIAAHRPERARFHLGDQWLGFDLHQYESRHAEPGPWDTPEGWLWAAEACGANSIQTRGLARFGLPELLIDEVDCRHHLIALNILRALAQSMLAEQWAWFGSLTTRPGGASVRRVDARYRVNGGALAAFWSTSLAIHEPFLVAVTGGGQVVRVEAPGRGPVNDWLAGHWSTMASWAGCPPDDFDRYTSLSPTET